MGLDAAYTIYAMRALAPQPTASIGGPVLIIGDSIINQVPESYSACGYPVLKFAVNGMRVHDIIPWIDRLMDFKPSVVVLALGKNDMGAPGSMDVGLGQRWYWVQDYFWTVAYIIAASKANGRPLKPILMTILPTERAAPYPWNNLELLGWYNQYLAQVAEAFGCDVVDFAATYPGIPRIVTDGPYLTPGFTWPYDGIYIHPMGANTAKMWRYIQLAVKKGLSQAGMPLLASDSP
jgi:hypothetical protein